MAYVLDDDKINMNMNIWGCYYPTRNVLNQRGNPSIYTIPKQKKAVVSVPVHFIGSDSWKKSRSDYAVKIQKSFRGFRVRKIINKLLELNRAVDDVAAAADDLILRRDDDDDKERLKFNEALMSLLFKLDAVTAFDDPVRVCRKNVIRKACLLLETIDSIRNPADSHVLQTPHQLDGKPAEDECSDDYSEDDCSEDGYSEDDCSEDDYSEDDYSEDDCSEDDYSEDDYYDDDDDDDDDEEEEESFGKSSEVDDNAAVDPTAQDKGEVLSDDEVADETLEKPSQVEKAASVDMEKKGQVEEEEEEEADASDDDGKGWGADDDDGEAWECVGQEDDNMEFLDIGQGVGDKQRQGGWLLVKENKDSHDNDNLMVKLLMEENHKLMKTVAQLCNKTEDQAVLITKLFDRVKQLEVSVQELEDVHLFGSLGINKADKGWRSFLPTAR